MTDILQKLRVAPGTKAGFGERDPADRLGVADKDAGRAQVHAVVDELDEYQAKLWAESARSVLLVLQGLDTSGKDGAIRKVLSGINPQGTHVSTFKAPNDAELDHDYLWRIHLECPTRGKLGVFNRSHYEDAVTARLVGAVDRDQCRLRYRHIVEFERMLSDEGTTLVKVFLHISKDEQKERLQARVDDPAKNWKFNPADLETRKRWDEYMDAYEEALSETSSDHAPWFIVPADHKWVRDVAVATLLVDTFRRLDPQYPAADPEIRGIVIE
jgi:PPK2 family polyphosphate:nucleotide phosphotransferase